MGFHDELRSERLAQDKRDFLRRIYEHGMTDQDFEEIKGILDEMIPEK